ncbi:MAG TPA: membrane protein insertion efficiency factor YidD [Kofleriaceae bacterium]
MALRQVAVLPLRLYRLAVSPLLPPACRFHPTCSAYAVDAIVSHGVIRGAWLATRRVLRCHPWSEPAVDHVPARGR